MQIRAAETSDAKAIRNVHLEVFPTGAEADLVEQLDHDGDALISVVAIEDERVVGHILFSRMDAEADGRPVNALGLAPVAVLPDRQHRGIGSALIEAGLAMARTGGAEIVFVLGDQHFYGRFGFKAATAAPFESSYSGPHLQALPFVTDLATVGRGIAQYADAFTTLG